MVAGRRPVLLDVRHGPRLQDVQRLVREAEFDILRPPEVPLDRLPDPGNLANLFLGEARPRLIDGGDTCTSEPSSRVFVEHELLGLVDDLGHDRPFPLVDDERVGIQSATDQTFACAVKRADRRLLRIAAGHVAREHDPAHPSVDHLLDHHGNTNVIPGDPLAVAVRECPHVIRRRPYLADRGEHGLEPADKQETVVHPRERLTLGVFARRRAPHRHKLILTDLCQRVSDRRDQLVRQRNRRDLAAERLRELLEPRRVVGIGCLEGGPNVRENSSLAQLLRKRRGRHDEERRHFEFEPAEPDEVGRLPSEHRLRKRAGVIGPIDKKRVWPLSRTAV